MQPEYSYSSFYNHEHLGHGLSWPPRQRTALGMYHLLEQRWPVHVWERENSHARQSMRSYLVYLM